MDGVHVEIEEGFPDLTVIVRCPENGPEVAALLACLRDDGGKLPGVKDGVTHLIDYRDVLYFESVDKRSFIYTATQVYETPLRLYQIEERLTDTGFFRSSKSQIVNIAEITALCPDFAGRMEVVLSNGERIIISRHYARALKERLALR
ncbi:MAG: LytTR family transcriptional regulator DNA-binding domain-containing protein [Propionibacteriaceae bacterium]|nr:LytTR family transcriptional regulator DNA-binding domain-containing protein [Propionibacteriaceae bacterium]